MGVLTNQLSPTKVVGRYRKRDRSKDREKRRIAENTGEWAKKFLNEWNESKTKLTGWYNQAMGDVTKSWGMLDKAGGYVEQVGGMFDEIGTEFENYKQTFQPLEQEAITTAGEALGTERGLMQKIRDLSEAD